MTEQARAPSTERTTSSSRGRKAMRRRRLLRRRAWNGLIPSGHPATALVGGSTGEAVQRRGRAPVDGQREGHLVGVLRAACRQGSKVLHGNQQGLRRGVDRRACV